VRGGSKLHRCLEITEELHDRRIAERFRRGKRKSATLPGLLQSEKDRRPVLQYIHARSSELLRLCRENDFPVTVDLDTRASPLPHPLHFAAAPWRADMCFSLGADRLTYRLRLVAPDQPPRPVRYLDPLILTNRPSPGWLRIGRALVRVAHLRGEAVRPFLTKDAIAIPLGEVGRYLREFVARAARVQDIRVEGMDLRQHTRPDSHHFSARLNPFTQRYELTVSHHYGPLSFASDDTESVRVATSARPPYRIDKAIRSREREGRALAPLSNLGLRHDREQRRWTPTGAPDAFSDLQWLLDHRDELHHLGFGVEFPAEDDRPFVAAAASLTVTPGERGDWLELKGRVTIGDHDVPFQNLVDYLRRGERRFPLPDGTLFLLPSEWFTRYGPALRLAETRGNSVRLARSQAAILSPAGTGTPRNEEAIRLSETYVPGPNLRATLRPYQLEGVRWLVRHHYEGLGACLADDMGLGKTLQTIAVLVFAKNNAPASPPEPSAAPTLFSPVADDEGYLNPLRALVVLPASLVYNWTNELEKFAPSLTVLIHTGPKRPRDARILRRYDILLTTYQTALRDVAVLTELDLSYIVLDESQQIKNRKSKVFRALNELPARHRISLSGTPIENSLSDLWSQMQFINPGLLRSFAFFRRTFLQPIELHDDEERKRQLRQLVSPHLLRRTKEEVAPDLPDLEVQLFACPMTTHQHRYYERERSAARNALLGIGPPREGAGAYKLRVIQTLTRLRQLANHPRILDADYGGDSGKFSEVMEQWRTVRRSGHKVLFFSSMVRHLALYRDRLSELGEPFAWLTGEIAADERARQVGRFQEDPAVGTFFISLRAGGTGLNLTAADYVFLLDPWWNPTVEDQAIARAHRIGRSGKVFARKFISQGSLEEKINLLQQRKKKLAEEIIDGTEAPELDTDEIDFLLS
jgi:non-specific serine/threonine protein kinase